MAIKQNINPKIELQETIANSSLDPKHKKLWQSFIQQLIDSEVAIILETLQQDPKNLLFLTENLNDKSAAIKSKNKSVWREIIKKEKDYIENY